MKKLSITFILAIAISILTTNAFAQNSDTQRGEDFRTDNNVVTQGATGKKRNDLTGTWLVNLQIDESKTIIKEGISGKAFQLPQGVSGTNSLAPFSAVETFHTDGTFIENSFADYIAPQATPGQGLWALTGNGEFALTFYGVLIGSVTDPQFQGTYKVRSKLTTNEAGDQFSGPFKIDIFDPSGNFLASLDGTVQARRAVLESLP
jgi:hypothetical protein